ncbi:MAG: AAA domain-containing protein [bacterium]
MNDIWDQLAGLWKQERATTRRRFAEQRATTSLETRVERGFALKNAEIDETAAAAGDRVTLWISAAAGGLDGFRAGVGTPVRLWLDRVDGPEHVLGVVSRRKAGRLAVVVDGFPPDRFFDVSFHIDTDAPETTFDRADKAIRAFAAAKERDDLGDLKAVLAMKHRPQSTRQSTAWSPFDTGLHEAQHAAVQNALDAQQLALVHGPPGTGKTRTLVEIIRQEVARGHRVLVTAASNTAVDTIGERLLDAGLDPLRLGHPARVMDSLEDQTLDARLEARPDFNIVKKWQDEATKLFRKAKTSTNLTRTERRELFQESRRLQGDARKHLRGIQEAIVAASPVICATAAGADMALLNDVTFDVVVLDEATQTPDPIALIAAQRARRLIMAGDPRQLPPTIIDQDAERAGLGTTFFERLEEHAVMLEVQHRMHVDIMTFSSNTFYHGRLRAAPDVANRRVEDLGVLHDPLRPAVIHLIDTAGKSFDEQSSDEDPSTSNPLQAQRTAAEVRRILSRGLPSEDLAVITPYEAQARLLRKLLDIPGLEIGTVDGFQGREKEAIVIDLVRSNPRQEVGFLADTRRLNVALTRAKRLLLVVGDSATLGGKPFFAGLFDHIERAGGWISAWSDDADPF